MPKPLRAAFFDVDRTVVARSSTLAFGGHFYREGLISLTAALRLASLQLAFVRLGANERQMERARAALLEVTRGWEAERVRRLVEETLQQVIGPLIYAEALDLFAQHREAGHELYLVSSAGMEVVRPLAEYLGIPHVIATLTGIDERGRYNGTLAFYAYGRHKAVAIVEEADRRHIDLAASWAYSDSITDLPMLEAVGHPVAVNADRVLRAIARERGWEIRDFNRPVTLPRRLPRPRAEVLVGAGALGVAAFASWRVQRNLVSVSARASGHRPTRALRGRHPPASTASARPGSCRHTAQCPSTSHAAG